MNVVDPLWPAAHPAKDQVMQLTKQDADRLTQQGIEALRLGRSAEARTYLSKAVESGAAGAQARLLLAVACRGEGDFAAEEAAVDGLLAIEPMAIRGRIMKGQCRARAGDDAGASRYFRSAIQVAEGQQLHPEVMAELQNAQSQLAEIDARIEARVEARLVARGLPPSERSPRFQRALDIDARRRRVYLQEPTAFYYPELPQIQFYDRSDFDWARKVEAAADSIRKELAGLLREGTDRFRPYVQPKPGEARMDRNRELMDNRSWSAMFLCENGRIDEEIVRRCPRTWEAVQAAPLPTIAGWGPTVMFSLLRAGARIAAHTGMYNTRLTCHLPLILPPDCRFRVGNETREWELDKLLIFDDSIEHEAWNDSPEDRVVLIFDIWRPELSDRERHEFSALFGRDARPAA